MANPAIRTTVIVFLGALSVVYFSALPILGYMAVAGAMINNMSATGPLVLFIGFPRRDSDRLLVDWPTPHQTKKTVDLVSATIKLGYPSIG